MLLFYLGGGGGTAGGTLGNNLATNDKTGPIMYGYMGKSFSSLDIKLWTKRLTFKRGPGSTALRDARNNIHQWLFYPSSATKNTEMKTEGKMSLPEGLFSEGILTCVFLCFFPPDVF